MWKGTGTSPTSSQTVGARAPGERPGAPRPAESGPLKSRRVPVLRADWHLVAQHRPGCSPPKSGQEARLVEGKLALFWMPDWMGRGDVYPESYCPLLTTSGQELLEAEGGAACRDGTVSSSSHPEAGHRWSDQHHLGCFTYSRASVPWLVCSHFLEASPQNCSSVSRLQSAHHVVNFSTCCGFPNLQDSSQALAQSISYSPWGGTNRN